MADGDNLLGGFFVYPDVARNISSLHEKINAVLLRSFFFKKKSFVSWLSMEELYAKVYSSVHYIVC